jgi:ferritin
MRIQSSEEADHAERFIHFLIARGGRVAIGDIAAPTSRYGAPETVFEAALAHERKVTGEIRSLYESATEHGDLESFPLLHEFLAEQVEEESTLETIVAQLRRVGDSQPALLMIDRELGARSATG